MKLLSRLFALCLIMSATSLSLAHEGHEHAAPLDQITAVETADIKIFEKEKETIVQIVTPKHGDFEDLMI